MEPPPLHRTMAGGRGTRTPFPEIEPETGAIEGLSVDPQRTPTRPPAPESPTASRLQVDRLLPLGVEGQAQQHGNRERARRPPSPRRRGRGRRASQSPTQSSP